MYTCRFAPHILYPFNAICVCYSTNIFIPFTLPLSFEFLASTTLIACNLVVNGIALSFLLPYIGLPPFGTRCWSVDMRGSQK
jgi:hypothetical protein